MIWAHQKIEEERLKEQTEARAERRDHAGRSSRPDQENWQGLWAGESRMWKSSVEPPVNEEGTDNDL